MQNDTFQSYYNCQETLKVLVFSYINKNFEFVNNTLFYVHYKERFTFSVKC